MKQIVFHLRRGLTFWSWMLVANSIVPIFCIWLFFVLGIALWIPFIWFFVGFTISSWLFFIQIHRVEDAERIYFAKGELLNEIDH